jgi:hypothetical protein
MGAEAGVISEVMRPASPRLEGATAPTRNGPRTHARTKTRVVRSFILEVGSVVFSAIAHLLRVKIEGQGWGAPEGL